MILKFKMGLTDWKLIDGFKEIHYFNVKKVELRKDEPCCEGQEFYTAWGAEERFNPSTVYHVGQDPIGPTNKMLSKDVGVIGKMKNPDDSNMFLLLGVDEVFILNDEGRTIERI